MLPLFTSAAIGSFFGAVLAGIYWLAPVGIVLTLIADGNGATSWDRRPIIPTFGWHRA